jgi:hypothetical protein
MEIFSLLGELLIMMGLTPRVGRKGIDMEWSRVFQSITVGGSRGAPRGWLAWSDQFSLCFSTVGYSRYSDFLQEKVCGGWAWRDDDTGKQHWVFPTKQKATGVCALCAVLLLGQTCPSYLPYFVKRMSKSLKDGWKKDTYTIAATVASLGSDLPVFHLVREESSYWLYFAASGLLGNRANTSACFVSYWSHPTVAPLTSRLGSVRHRGQL